MKRTRISSLLGLGLAGIVVAFLVDLGVAAAGRPVLVPPLTLPLTLVVIAAVVLVFAVPIYRATRGTKKMRIDPFRAMRVAVLAKASSLSGALVLGIGIGVLIYLVSRAVPATASIWLAAATIGGALILLIAGLLAEHFCTIPPGDDEDERGVPEPNRA
ncbi:DUF3180 domain-containing protein [Microbacteriaceae bacterium VKM Ac-2855]|nr:DUF3180 domain-containing protein [Microbacteriaceae bacterium VKM Ac-2855]